MKIDKLRIGKKHDGRIKLSDEDRKEILALKETMTQKECGRRYGVDRRTISFIWYPERLKQNIQRRKERGGSKAYYNKDAHRESMQKHRAKKKKLKEILTKNLD